MATAEFGEAMINWWFGVAARRVVVLSVTAGLLFALGCGPVLAAGDQGWQWKLRLISTESPADGEVLERQPGAPPPAVQDLSVLARKPLASAPAGERGFTPAEGQIIVRALSLDGEILWHRMFPDPRLIRTEMVDPDGRFKGRKQFFRKQVDFSILVPSHTNRLGRQSR